MISEVYQVVRVEQDASHTTLFLADEEGTDLTDPHTVIRFSAGVAYPPPGRFVTLTLEERLP